MTTRTKIVIGGVAVGLLLIPLIGFWMSLLVILGVLVVTTVASLIKTRNDSGDTAEVDAKS